MTAGRIVWFAADALSDMVDEVARRLPVETGGLLVGYEDASGAAVVTAVVGPGPRAVHGGTRFRPDTEFQQNRLAVLYEESGRIHGYLGDWHSHPNGMVAPSRRDRRVLSRIGRKAAARAPRAVMAIVGPSGEGDLDLTVAAWTLADRRGRGGRSVVARLETRRFE